MWTLNFPLQHASLVAEFCRFEISLEGMSAAIRSFPVMYLNYAAYSDVKLCNHSVIFGIEHFSSQHCMQYPINSN